MISKPDLIRALCVMLWPEARRLGCEFRIVNGIDGGYQGLRLEARQGAWRGTPEMERTLELYPHEAGDIIVAEARALLATCPGAKAEERARLASVKTFATVGKWRRWSQPCAS